jgi:hypothetical protein
MVLVCGDSLLIAVRLLLLVEIKIFLMLFVLILPLWLVVLFITTVEVIFVCGGVAALLILPFKIRVKLKNTNKDNNNFLLIITPPN